MGEEERNFFLAKRFSSEEEAKKKKSRKRILTIGEEMEKKKKRRIEKAWMKRRGKGGARKETREGIKLGCEAIKKLIGRYKRENYKCKMPWREGAKER